MDRKLLKNSKGVARKYGKEEPGWLEKEKKKLMKLQLINRRAQHKFLKR